MRGIPSTTQSSLATVTSGPIEQQGVASTTTLIMLGHATITETVTAASTISATETESLTSTSTVALAAPRYSQVFGPKAGCTFTDDAPAQQLDDSITDSMEATQKCKDLCTQRAECSFVYIQHLFVDYGPTTPHYQCYFNDHPLDAAADLECGRNEGIWGEACGFDAMGRGLQFDYIKSLFQRLNRVRSDQG
ncbi:hypothetical protein B0A50_06361 [Salinomyces thailandicus]|uniref:Uncharacterized protein n=1 Tax=Salinomyces thailandicus TaxID=706561 RepID=A0A4U0TR21_9PEZI|nr:hypothetical protein B0A50_06361 [Salinomyces thailandica]